jgi:hypothetical protein
VLQKSGYLSRAIEPACQHRRQWASSLRRRTPACFGVAYCCWSVCVGSASTSLAQVHGTAFPRRCARLSLSIETPSLRPISQLTVTMDQTRQAETTTPFHTLGIASKVDARTHYLGGRELVVHPQSHFEGTTTYHVRSLGQVLRVWAHPTRDAWPERSAYPGLCSQQAQGSAMRCYIAVSAGM